MTTAKSNRYHPRRWRLVTWLLVLLWLWVGLVGNMPVFSDKSPVRNASMAPPPGMGAAFRTSVVSGFPSQCYRQSYSANGTPSPGEVLYGWWAFNALCVIGNLIGLLYILQRLPQFSIRSMMIGAAVVAAMIVFVKNAVNYWGMSVVFQLMMIVYFLPMVGGVIGVCLQRFKRFGATKTK